MDASHRVRHWLEEAIGCESGSVNPCKDSHARQIGGTNTCPCRPFVGMAGDGIVWVSVGSTERCNIIGSFTESLLRIKPCNDSRARCSTVHAWLDGGSGNLSGTATSSAFSPPRIALTASVSVCSLVRGDESGDSGDIVDNLHEIKNPQSLIGCGFEVVSPARFEPATPGLEEPHSGV